MAKVLGIGAGEHLDGAVAPRGYRLLAANVRAALERRLLDAFLERVRQQHFTDEAEREERLRSVQNRIVDLLERMGLGARIPELEWERDFDWITAGDDGTASPAQRARFSAALTGSRGQGCPPPRGPQRTWHNAPVRAARSRS